MFLAVTLEESGLLGSEWYARNPPFPLAQAVGGVNMDGLAPTGPTRDISASGGDKSELTAILALVMATMGLTMSPESFPERGGYYRSDHFSLAKRGVPMFRLGHALATGSTWPNWHPTDEFRAVRDKECAAPGGC